LSQLEIGKAVVTVQCEANVPHNNRDCHIRPIQAVTENIGQ